MRLLLALLLLAGCSAQDADPDADGTAARAFTAAPAAPRAVPATPLLWYWVGREGAAELRSLDTPGEGHRAVASLETADGYLPFAGIDPRGGLLAAVVVPPDRPGHPQEAELRVGPPAGPWAVRATDALRLQHPQVVDGAVFWIRLDDLGEDGTTTLSALRDEAVLRSGAASWMQFVPTSDGALLYELGLDGEASLTRFDAGGRPQGRLALGRGQGRNFVADGATLRLHWQPAGEGAQLRTLDLRTGADRAEPAAGFGERSFVAGPGGIEWSDGARFPEVATSRGVLWREPGPRWVLGGAALTERGEGLSWVGEAP
jgi:hypothetical protein